ncbi:MAG TPA: hypothetical protein VNA89_04975 [Gemmatimonadaceae bacterium]|nr:hypothetical protein [Gemmatimonadaceae bacterium]
MELEQILARSAADDAVKAAVRELAANPCGLATSRAAVAAARPAPAVKVLRVLTQLLHAEPALRVRRVRLDATSGCGDFTGILRVDADDERAEYAFSWDCRWRAAEAGLLDPWGYPDQTRAAQQFGWRCFARWELRARSPLAAA